MGRLVSVIVTVLLGFINLIKCELYPEFMNEQELEDTFGLNSFNREHPYKRSTKPPQYPHIGSNVERDDPVYKYGKKPPPNDDQNLDIPGAPPHPKGLGRAGPTVPPNMDENSYLRMLLLQPTSSMVPSQHVVTRSTLSLKPTFALYYLIPGSKTGLTYRPTHMQTSSPRDTRFKSISNLPTQLELSYNNYQRNIPTMRSFNVEESEFRAKIPKTYASDPAGITKHTGSLSDDGPPLIQMRAQMPLQQLNNAMGRDIPHTSRQKIDTPKQIYSFSQEKFQPETQQNKQNLNHMKPIFRNKIDASMNEMENKTDDNQFTDINFKSLYQNEVHKPKFNVRMPTKNAVLESLFEENSRFSQETKQDKQENKLYDGFRPDEDVKFSDLILKSRLTIGTTEPTSTQSFIFEQRVYDQDYVKMPVQDSVVSY